MEPATPYVRGKYYSIATGSTTRAQVFSSIPRPILFLPGAVLPGHDRGQAGRPGGRRPGLRRAPEDAGARRGPQRHPGLARLAIARILYERSQFDKAIESYLSIPRQSKYWPEALREQAWTYIKAKDWQRAYRSVNLLLLADPDVPDGPDLRILEGNLQLRMSNFYLASDTFSKVRDEFEPESTASWNQVMVRSQTNPATSTADGKSLDALLVALALLCHAPLGRLDEGTDVRAADVELLQRTSIFGPLPYVTLRRLAASLEECQALEGEAIVTQGEPGELVYVIAAGRVLVSRDGRVIRELGPGDVFGELALMLDVPRTARDGDGALPPAAPDACPGAFPHGRNRQPAQHRRIAEADRRTRAARSRWRRRRARALGRRSRRRLRRLLVTDERCHWKAPAELALVLERDVEADAVARHLALLDRDVEPGRFGDPQVADGLRRRLDRIPRGRLPRVRAHSDDLGHAIHAVAHLGSSRSDRHLTLDTY